MSFEYSTTNTSNSNVGEYHVKDDSIPDFEISKYWGSECFWENKRKTEKISIHFIPNLHFII